MSSAREALGPRRGIYYGWLVVASAFIVAASGSGVVYSFGVFFKPLQAELGWSRAVVSGVFSTFMISRGVSGMAIGWLADRIGTRLVVAGGRLVVAGGSLLAALGLVLTARATTLWQLYVFYGFLVGVGLSVSFILPFASATRWFEQRRGLALGVVAGSIGLGTLVVPPVAQQLILAFGWRWAYTILALTVLVLMLAAAPFLRRNPEEMGLLPYGGSATGSAKATTDDMPGPELSIRQVLSSRPVQVISLAYFLLTISGQTVWVHLVNHATDLGIDPLVAATFVSVSGGVSIAGRLILGATSDRTGAKVALLIAQGVLLSALVLLLFADRTGLFFLFAAVFGFAYGGTVPQLPALMGQIFGLRSLGLLLGVTGIPVSLGAATGPYIAGLIFDMTGSYRIAFILAATLTLLGLLVVPWLKVPSRRHVGRPTLRVERPTE